MVCHELRSEQSLFRVSRKTQALRLEGEGGLPDGVVCGASVGTLATAVQDTGAQAIRLWVVALWDSHTGKFETSELLSALMQRARPSSPSKSC